MADDESDYNEPMSVLDLDAFCLKMLEAVDAAYDGGAGIKDCIQVWQVKDLLKDHNLGKDADGNFIVTLQTMRALHAAIFDLHLNSTLSKMAAEGIIECAWDDEANEPIFSLNPAAIDYLGNVYKKRNDGDEQPEA